MTRRLPLLVLALCLATPLVTGVGAQTPVRPGRSGWSTVRIAKWSLLAGAAAFGIYSLAHSTRAQDAYDGLRELCDKEPARCTLEDGHYSDAGAEQLYDTAREEDKKAQVGIVGGQVTLLGSVGLFIYDLRNGRGPENIPYPTRSRAGGPAVAAGVRLSF